MAKKATRPRNMSRHAAYAIAMVLRKLARANRDDRICAFTFAHNHLARTLEVKIEWRPDRYDARPEPRRKRR